MKKVYLLSLPVLALVAVAGVAAAFPMTDIDDMTPEEKDLRVQVLELKQEMIQTQIAYLNGELTEEQFRERLQALKEDMEPLREQLMAFQDGEGCPHGMGKGMGRFAFGPGMWG